MASSNTSLLLVFVHGFKGKAESTFEQYPDRLVHLLLQTHPNAAIEARIYPTYETRGSLELAVDGLVDWLTAEVGEFEGKHGPTQVVFCGHSMGGLVSMDAALLLRRTTPSKQEAWPRIGGVLAYDTPFIGVHPHVFKHQLSTYQEYANSAIKLGAILGPLGGGLAAQFASRNASDTSDASSTSSRKSTAAWIGVGTAALAAAGTLAATSVLNKVNPVNDSYRWISDHLAFVRNLWEVDAMERRLRSGLHRGIPFHCFYTRLINRPNTIGLQSSASLDPTTRTFILVPSQDQDFAPHFSALDTIEAHTSMFHARTNPSYFKMGLESAQLISNWFDQGNSRGARHNPIDLDPE